MGNSSINGGLNGTIIHEGVGKYNHKIWYTAISHGMLVSMNDQDQPWMIIPKWADWHWGWPFITRCAHVLWIHSTCSVNHAISSFFAIYLYKSPNTMAQILDMYQHSPEKCPSHVIILVWLTPLSKWVITETSRQHPLDMDNNACIYFTDVSGYKGAICLTGTCPRRTHPAKVIYIYIYPTWVVNQDENTLIVDHYH